jgi:hypothetical protein
VSAETTRRRLDLTSAFVGFAVVALVIGVLGASVVLDDEPQVASRELPEAAAPRGAPSATGAGAEPAAVASDPIGDGSGTDVGPSAGEGGPAPSAPGGGSDVWAASSGDTIARALA